MTPLISIAVTYTLLFPSYPNITKIVEPPNIEFVPAWFTETSGPTGKGVIFSEGFTTSDSTTQISSWYTSEGWASSAANATPSEFYLGPIMIRIYRDFHIWDDGISHGVYVRTMYDIFGFGTP